MGGTKQVQAHVREAWLAITQAQQVERLKPLLDHQTQPIMIIIMIITFTEAKGLPQEQLPAMQGTRVDWRSDNT